MIHTLPFTSKLRFYIVEYTKGGEPASTAHSSFWKLTLWTQVLTRVIHVYTLRVN